MLTNGKNLAFSPSKMESYLQGLRHRNDISADCFKKISLAADLRIDWRRERAEPLAQLKAIIVSKAKDDGNPKMFAAEIGLWVLLYKRSDREGRIWAVRIAEDSGLNNCNVSCH